MKLPGIMEKYRAEVDIEIKTVLDERRTPLYDMMRYHFGWLDEKGNRAHNITGKALRPALCLYSCEAVGGNYHQALPAAAALELVHNFSLIHDDIQDDDKERHHRPTVWAVWGKPQAINAGTAMRILANSALARYQGDGLSPQKQLILNRRLDEITLKIIEGQYLDISFEDCTDIELNDYLSMIGKKTAALISGSMEIGALLGTTDEVSVVGFREIGNNLGMAFQIQDDILGVWGDSVATGKPSGNDIRRRKKGFPIVCALQKVNGDLRKELVEGYQNGIMSEDSVDRVMDIFKSAGIRDIAEKTVEQYCNGARKIFNQLKVSPVFRSQIEEIMEFSSGRNY